MDLEKVSKKFIKKEKQYRTLQLIPTLCVFGIGIALIIMINFIMSGIVAMVISILLYWKVYTDSKKRENDWVNIMDIHRKENEQ